MFQRRQIGLCAFLLTAGLCLAACSDDDTSEEKKHFDDGPRGEMKFSKVKTIESMGLYPNQVVVHGDFAYAIASGDNVVMRIDLDSFKVDKAYIDLGQNANPYAMTFEGDDIYVVNSVSNTLVKTRTTDPKSLETLASANHGLNMPMDVVVNPYTQAISVGCADYNTNGVAEGKIVSLNHDGSFSEEKDALEIKNITALYAVPKTKFMTAVGSGNYVFDSDYEITGTHDNGVRVTDYSTAATPVSETILKNEDVGKMAFLDDSRVWLVGSSFSSKMHSIHYNKVGDYQTSTLQLDSGKGMGMYIPVAIDDTHAVIADFNHDKLYVVDLNQSDVRAWAEGSNASAAAAAESIKASSFALSSTSVDRRGPVSMAVDPKRSYILVLNSLSETLDVISYGAGE